MFNKIFRSALVTSLTVLLLSFCLIFGVLYAYFEGQVFEELESEAGYIAYGIRDDAEGFVENLQSDRKRITLISADGTVLADTKAEVENLDNHMDRKEIREAAENGSGRSARYSHTLLEKTLYYAKRLEDGSILRVSTTQNSVVTVLLGLIQPVLVIIVLALILSLILSHRVSKAMIKPILSIDPEHPSEAEAYEELSPLLKKMVVQKQTIEKQIRQAEQSREEFRLITENMREGFLIIDTSRRVLSYNRAAADLLGVEALGQDSVLTYDRSRTFREAVQTALAGEGAEVRMNHDKGIYHLTVNPVWDQDKVIGAVLVMIDITESVKREQLRREFTSNVSHELKTPLTSISGFAEMMRSGGMSNETVIDFSSSIYEEAQRLISLVSDIMKISELDEGVAFDQETVDLYDVSCDVADRLRPIADQNRVCIQVHGEGAEVQGNAKIIDEMIYNLCDNAIKYNREGGRVDVIISSTATEARVCVQDTGIGIPQGEQERVFERFYRADKSRSKTVDGTGLGLAIVKHGAICHHAGLSLKSTLGKGTDVTITFQK